jgi:antitoxin (DNA-binding transcriptional repressor) of toxin-antitoxin stability system
MKVKTGELKTHLSRYLRQLQDSDESIEVCVRERPVAYLTSIKGAAMGDVLNRETAALKERLQSAGLTLRGNPPRPATPVPVPPQVAGDGRTDINSIEEIRATRNW